MRPDAPLHLVWDWNGTLLDDSALIADAMNAAYRAAGLAAISNSRYRKSFSLSPADLIRRTHGVLPGPAVLKRMGDAYHHHYRSGLTDLAPDALDALAAADELGATQSLLSLHPHDALIKALDHHGLTSRFLAVTGRSGEASGGKHALLREHLALLARSGVTPPRIFLIGDTADDGDAAREAGVHAVLHTAGVEEHTGRHRRPVADSLLEAVHMAARTSPV